MFCPRCGTIQRDEQRERCSRCQGLLARPDHRELAPIRVVEAPTRRGELAQRAAGIVPPPRPQRLSAPAPAPVPPPTPAPVPALAPDQTGSADADPTAVLGAPVAAPRAEQPGGAVADSTSEETLEASPGEPGWPPPPGPWQPAPPPPPDRRGPGWQPRPNER